MRKVLFIYLFIITSFYSCRTKKMTNNIIYSIAPTVKIDSTLR